MITPEEGSFLTHANYIRALASEAGSRLFASDKRALEHLAGRVALLPSIADARPPKVDLDQVRRSLTIAWGTITSEEGPVLQHAQPTRSVVVEVLAVHEREIWIPASGRAAQKPRLA